MSADPLAGAPRSLYLHLPFCSRRCPYCDFAIAVGGAEARDRYLEALLVELDRLAAAGLAPLPLETVYLGGGTPSLLGEVRLGRLMERLWAEFSIADAAEITLEANPEDVSAEAAAEWARLGFTRVSLGVQSLDDPTLSWLGRGHDARRAEEAVARLRESAVPQINCDLIYAVPTQSAGSFTAGLRRLLQHHPDHVSCYELTVEAGTVLDRGVRSGRTPGPREEDSLEQGRLAEQMLNDQGLRRYEVSNYCRPGAESRHNLNYWRGGQYLAAGAGAHGFLGPAEAGRLGLAPDGVALRYWHLRAAATYSKAVMERGLGWRGSEWLTPDQLQLERLALGLRLNEGTPVGAPGRRAAALRLAGEGLLELEGERIRATARGLEVLDRVTLELAAA